MEHPEDPRGTAGLERQAERLVLVQSGHRRRLGPDGSRRRRWQRGSRCRGSFVALGDGLAGRQARRIGVGGADPRCVRVEGQPLERGQDLGRGRMLARRDRGRVARVVVDPVDLGQPVARRRLEGVRIGRTADGCPEAALGGVLGRMDRARIGPRGRLESCRLVRVVCALGGAQGLRRGIRLAAGARCELAALGGQSPLLGASFGPDGCLAHRRLDLGIKTPSSPRPVRPPWTLQPIARGRDARQRQGGLHDPPGDRRVVGRFDRDGAGHRPAASAGCDAARRAWAGRSHGDRTGRCPIANGRSTVNEAGRDGCGRPAPIRRSTGGRFGAWCREPVVGQRGRPSGDRIVCDRQADLARHGWSSTQHLDERRTAEDAEDEAEGQEAELARRHPGRTPRLALLRLDAIIAGPM
jgi:hypothetical protein